MCDPGVDVAGLCNKAEYTVTRDRSTGSVELNPDGSYNRVYRPPTGRRVTFGNDRGGGGGGAREGGIRKGPQAGRARPQTG